MNKRKVEILQSVLPSTINCTNIKQLEDYVTSFYSYVLSSVGTDGKYGNG